jgi:hypothetical protein
LNLSSEKTGFKPLLSKRNVYRYAAVLNASRPIAAAAKKVVDARTALAYAASGALRRVLAEVGLYSC